jgi:hypothetical protein
LRYPAENSGIARGVVIGTISGVHLRSNTLLAVCRLTAAGYVVYIVMPNGGAEAKQTGIESL